MKWEITNTSDGHEIYELRHRENKLLTLDFHPFTNSARIEYAAEKRVFLIECLLFYDLKRLSCEQQHESLCDHDRQDNVSVEPLKSLSQFCHNREARRG